jgi:hypothetical protein
MRGIGQCDAIESVTFRHAEGNERKKNEVKRGIAAFYGCKLLKRQAEHLSIHRIMPQHRRHSLSSERNLLLANLEQRIRFGFVRHIGQI